MRSIWRGAVSFGLVSIGVKMYSATEDKDVRFHQVHREDGGRIKYKRVCSIDGEEVPYADIAKGFELPDGQLVILTDEDLEDMPLGTKHSIDVIEFVPGDQIDPILYEKTYYLEPDTGPAVRPYVLLREALEKSGRMALTKIAIRQREALAAIRVRDGVLVLHTMRWPDEIRNAEFGFLDEDITVRPQELKMADSLIESMVADFDPEEFSDDYREAMTALIESKQAGGEVHTPEPEVEEDSGGQVVDLMSALRASVARAKGGAAPVKSGPSNRGRGADDVADAESSRPAKKAAKSAAKSAPKKTAAKQTTAGKATAAKKAPAKKAAKAAKKAPAKKAVASTQRRRSA
ncbi:MAG: Ku protein [Geodermatophilaceae bacterium]|nr:Ku protein [Geodermatophilaceae bacterium]